MRASLPNHEPRVVESLQETQVLAGETHIKAAGLVHRFFRGSPHLVSKYKEIAYLYYADARLTYGMCTGQQSLSVGMVAE